MDAFATHGNIYLSIRRNPPGSPLPLKRWHQLAGWHAANYRCFLPFGDFSILFKSGAIPLQSFP
jgi:hypothetical protein